MREDSVQGVAQQPVQAIAIFNMLLRKRRRIIVPALVLATVVAVMTFVKPRTYTSESAFASQSRRNLSGLAEVASQFGIGVAASDPNNAPAFYSRLVTSRTVLEELAHGTYTLAGRDGDLLTLYRTRGTTPAARIERVVARLRADVAVALEQRTGVVTVRVRAPSPDLARTLSARLLELVDRYNRERRQSQAAAERRFAEQRLQEAETELRRAEDRLQAFLAANRDYRNSPVLVFEQDRLARSVAMRQSVFTQLAQSVEQAKIEQVRDTPVISVIDEPSLPARPDRRGLVLRTLLALLLGAGLGVLAAIGAASRSAATASGEREEFDALWHDLMVDIRRPWRLIWPPRTGQS